MAYVLRWDVGFFSALTLCFPGAGTGNVCMTILTERRKGMIYEVAGDILLTKAKAIAHGVAPNDHFDHGLARSLREAWPAMARDFRHYAQATHPKPGEIWSWAGVGGMRIYNLLTQEGEVGHETKPGRATLANVNHCLRRLRHDLEKNAVKNLALPKIATGVGGLSWDEVCPLIHERLGDLPIPIYLYTTFHAEQLANEPVEAKK
jgi:O-acetyl-ADP-ribose deacetylase (regulator of RNase III)